MSIPTAAHGGTALRLPHELRARIERWAAAAYPLESCGLLLGRRDGRRTEVVHARRARNLELARDRYELDPGDHLAAQDEAHALGLEVVGVWHAHPDHAARPSELDRARAWSAWSYVIVSIGREGARELRSWRLQEQQFVEQQLLP